MAIPWGAIVSGASSILASGIGSGSSAASARETNAQNLAIAREQMAFQERMDNSKYQRGVEDARKAGFNPLVAFPGSGGAPMGASAVMQNPNPNKGELALATAQAISDMLLTRAKTKTEETQQDLNKAEAERVREGEISNPLFGRVPIATVRRNLYNFATGGFTQLGGGISKAKDLVPFKKGGKK